MEEINQEIKKKRKFLGIPISICVILGVILVSASIIYLAYNHEFTKNINVFRVGTGDKYVQIIGTGDISDTTLNCGDSGLGCSVETGLIKLRNTDSNSHSCTIETTGNENVVVTYDTITSPVEIPSDSEISFKIKYESDDLGSYPMITKIDCALPVI